ncbi:MAG TPA: dihydrodipicolinate synthase family protein [Streptosporangiaceae bacterium]|nr:dihydrodipicolinate synthase family protein [Streptosporangiaceae bacterium]
MSELFGGAGVALVTVFDERGGADPAATAALARDLVARGMRAVLVCGTTGEAATLTGSERAAIIEAVRAAVPDAVPVIAGTGAPSAWQATRLTADAVRAGADAVLAWSPPGCELGGYYAAIGAAAGDHPVLAYHVPWISSPGVPVAALPSLPVAGVKDSSGSPDRLLDELAHYQGATYVGSSALLALAGPMGAAGAILALANVEPEDCCRAFAGDAEAQRALADRHLEVRDGGIPALKRILAKTRPISAVSRVS